MRPPTQQQSALRTPLNRILGTEANVRILRVLAPSVTPLGRGELARRAALRTSGTHVAVERLIQAGILELVGTGSNQQVRWAQKHPLAAALHALFESEARRVDRVLEGLKKAVANIRSVDAIWIESGFGTGRDKPGEPLIVGVVARSSDLQRIVDELQAAVARLERSEDITIEFRGRARADLASLSLAERKAVSEALPVFGLSPGVLVLGPEAVGNWRRASAHADHDEMARLLAQAIAAKLKADPGLVSRARKHIARRLKEASARERRELKEWDLILSTMSLPRLERFLTDHGERATRLRQTLPFLAILTDAERKAALSSPGTT